MWSIYRHLFQWTRTTLVRDSAWPGVLRKNGCCAPALDFTMTAYHSPFSTAQSKRTVCRLSNRLLPIQTQPRCSQQPEVVALLFRFPEFLSLSFAPIRSSLLLTARRRMSV